MFFSDKLQQDKYKNIPNMVMIGMFDKYFVAPETSIPPDIDTWLVDPLTTIRCSYNINSLSRIHTVLRAISQMQVSVKRVHNSIEDKLLSSQEKSKKLAAREDLVLKVGQLKNELAWQMNKLQQQKDIYDNCLKAIDERSHDLKKSFHELEKNRENHEEKKKTYFQIRENYIKENYQLLIRRKQLISELTTYIYPITETKDGRLCICSVYLPNSEQFHGQDDMRTAVALGYTCHLVEMMSHILDFPLRYPMHHNSSRSSITDHIHSKLTAKDKTFPLYAKGKEKFQFNYGVFLLNKNISQLRFYCGLGTTDLRLTLPNIKTLLESRLGIKFDSHEMGKTKLEFKDNLSIPSNGKTETVSSLASGGKNSTKHPEEVDLERALLTDKQRDEMDSKSANKENSPVHLTDDNTKRTGHSPSDNEEMFQASDDNFFKLKMTTFNNDSANNSSCGSFTEQTNGMMSFSRNFSLSPSPGSGENNISTENNLSGENDVLLVNHSTMQGADSKTSLGSCEELSSGEDTLESSKAPPSDSVCDNTSVTNSAIASEVTTTASTEEHAENINGHSAEILYKRT
ncbi:UV radiation resistance-associated protein-like [Mercenaria mercenaria]|uniref:UV radiation resistance-associated protein-like n=1 Tax=Mercenaria mercenaria TaxID=6596 RepID=UPI00234F3446|nr:UV radiation resistance-associated protein-like [Mercenaria mercenaria]